MTKIICGALCHGCQRHRLLFGDIGLCLSCVEDLCEMVGITIGTGPYFAARRCLISNLSSALSNGNILVEVLREAIFKATQTSPNSSPKNKKQQTR